MNCIINCTVCKRKVVTQVRILKWITFMAIANDILLNSSSDVISWLCNPEFYLEAVVRRCSIKKLFIKISQNSQENTCARVFFFLKVNFAKFLRTPIFIEHLWWLLLFVRIWFNVSRTPLRKANLLCLTSNSMNLLIFRKIIGYFASYSIGAFFSLPLHLIIFSSSF